MTEKKALIVDDSKLAQFVLKKMLNNHKLLVDSAESAEEALGYLTHQKPDVIFMDHTMPGMDGLQALKVIKSNPDTATIPIMMYTSQDDGVYLSEARALGAVDILPKQLKPVELEKVLQKLNLIGQHEALETAPRAVNDVATPIQFSANQKTSGNDHESDNEALSKLVQDAEAALEKETLKQFVKQQLSKQQQHFATLLKTINSKLDDISPQKQTTLETLLEDEYTRQPAKNTLWWPIALCVTLVVFGGLYFQLNQTLSELQQKPLPALPVSSTASESNNNNDTLVNNPLKASTTLLAALENTLNIGNDIPYGTPLLGDITLQKLFNLIVLLNEADFYGEINVVVHSGNFCLTSNSAGELVLPEQQASMSSCQVIEPITDIEQTTTPELSQFIGNVNDDPGNNFLITLETRGGSEPVASYPSISTLTTAGQWNQAAQRNRRVEFIFNESR